MSNTKQVAEWQIEHMKVRVLVDIDPTSCVPRVTIESDNPSLMDGVEVILRCGKDGATAEAWRKWRNSREFTLSKQ